MIGFTLDFPQLRDAATKGGGRYFTANTSQELSSAFTQIVTEIRPSATPSPCRPCQ
jgi:hypothetical protein